MGCMCSSMAYVASLGDIAFDEGEEVHNKFYVLDPSQRNTSNAQGLLVNAEDMFSIAANHYRKTKDGNLGAALLNLAAVKWDVYRTSSAETEEHLAEMVEEVIDLDNEALTLWYDTKPAAYPTLLANLAEAYLERFLKKRQTEDIQKSLSLYNDVCANIEEKNTRAYVQATMKIGVAYWTWYYNPSTRTDDQMNDAIQYLEKAFELCGNEHTDIRYSCLYHLAWINHYRFERQEKSESEAPQDYLGQVIYYYRFTLQLMPKSDVRYAKALGFLPVLLFHRYGRDKKEEDLQEAQKWAREALNFPDIANEDERQQLQAVCDLDASASPETTREVQQAVRRGTLDRFRSGSAESTSSMQSPVMVMPSISEVGGGTKEISGGMSGTGVIMAEPLEM